MSILSFPPVAKSGSMNSVILFDSSNIEPNGYVQEDRIILNNENGSNYQSLSGSFSQSLPSLMKDVVLVESDSGFDLNQMYFLIPPEENSSISIPTTSLSDPVVTPSPESGIGTYNNQLITIIDINSFGGESVDNAIPTRLQLPGDKVFSKDSSKQDNSLPENLKALNTDDKLVQRDSLLPVQAPMSKRIGKQNIVCAKCKCAFNSSSQYYLHRNTHLQDLYGKIAWSCGQCRKEFEGHDDLKSHELKEHGEIRLYPCPYCIQSFSKQLLLDYHIRCIHDKEKQFGCKVCDQHFFRSYDLKMHLNIHFDIKHHLCQFCGKQFSHSSNLLRHQRIHTKVKPYLCNICGRRFLQIPYLLDHRVSHTSGALCPECKAKFKSIGGLQSHIKTVHNKTVGTKEVYRLFYKNLGDKDNFRLYNCFICAKRFRFKRELLRHEKITHSGKSLPCKSCHKIFSDIKEFKLHSCISLNNNKAVSTKKKSSFCGETYECANCHKTFSSYHKSESHSCYKNQRTIKHDKQCGIEITQEDSQEETLLLCINTDQDGEPLPLLSGWVPNDTLSLNTSRCSDSPSDYSQGCNLNKDAENILLACTVPTNAEQKSPETLLNVVESNFVSFDNEKFKRKSKKGKKCNRNQVLICKYCKKTFTKTWNWQQHIATHDASFRKYKCSECSKSFSYRSTYTNHLKSHSKMQLAEKHKCPVCLKVYKSKSSLNQHQRRVHEKQINYFCKLCPKSFFSKCEFSYHMRIHKNETLYLCYVCGEGFSHVSHLYRHEKVHTGERPHKCHYCSKSFIQAVTLKVHMKKHESLQNVRAERYTGVETGAIT